MASNAVRGGLRVFFGNLPWTISQYELRAYATRFGPVTYCSVPFDRSTGFSKNYGFVTFSTPEGYNSCLHSGSYIMEGTIVNVNPGLQSPVNQSQE